MEKKLDLARRALTAALKEFRPRVGLILGSGLSLPGDVFAARLRVSVAKIPHLPRSSVAGHEPAWVAGEIEGVEVIVAGGRVHRYEGRTLAEVGFAVRLLQAAGCESLVVTNAAGGIREDLIPGTLMRIRDHLNLIGDSPLAGPTDEVCGPRFVDLSSAYDENWGARAHAAARDLGIPLAEGVYACCLGPQYETPAEVRMLRVLGADAVGMSTVPEVIVARQCGLRVFGLSLISNRAAGLAKHPLSHEEVLAAGEAARPQLAHLLAAIVRE